MRVDIQILEDALNVSYCADWIRTDASGGIDLFIGTVRNQTAGKTVVQLEFEAYYSMAKSEMQKIAEAALTKWDLQKVLIHHRTGVLKVGDIPVIIAVSSAHRHAAFEACRFIIDTLKQTVPIWKKEFFADGAAWVAAHP